MKTLEQALVFIDAGGTIASWLHIADGDIVQRGVLPEELQAHLLSGGAREVELVAVVPGEMVSLKWVELPTKSSQAQAVAIARLALTELTPEPLTEMHVAIGKAESRDAVPVAVVSNALMVSWLSLLRAYGLEPDVVIPDYLLLQEHPGSLIYHDREGMSLIRGEREAFSLEPEIADSIVKNRSVIILSNSEFEGGMLTALQTLPINLLQQGFVRRRQWKKERPAAKRIAILCTILIFLTLLIEVVTIARYSAAISKVEEELARLTGSGYQGEGSPAINGRQLRSPASGPRRTLSYGLSRFFASLQGVPNVRILRLRFHPGTITAKLTADAAGSVELVRSSLESREFKVEVAEPRAEGGQYTAIIVARSL